MFHDTIDAVEPSNQNPYDFILNSNHQPQKQSFGSSKGPNKLLAIVGLLSVVVILVVVIVSLVFSKSGGSAGISSVYAQQTEIIRILELGIQDTADTELKQQLSTLLLSVQSDARAISSVLGEEGTKQAKAEIALRKDAEIESALESARSAGTFDDVFLAAIKKQLVIYQKDLNTAFKQSSSDTKNIIATAAQSVETVLNSEATEN